MLSDRVRSLLGTLKARLSGLELVLLRLSSLMPLHAIRIAALRSWGARIHATATIYHGYEVRSARRLVVGEHSIVGDGAILDARGGLSIGANVNLSSQVHIWTGQHAWNSPDFSYESAPVVLEDRVWLGPRVTVLPGVTIGEGTVVAAGAVVAADLPPSSLAVGVPARVIREREKMQYELPHRRRKVWFW